MIAALAGSWTPAFAGAQSGHIAPVPEQVLLDELQPPVILRVHLQTLERRDLVQYEQHVALERVLYPALDEGDGDQPLAARDRRHLVEAVRRIDDRFAGFQLERQLRIAEADIELAAVV